MNRIYLIACLALLTCTKGKFVDKVVSIGNLDHSFAPKDELQYINYLKLILGRSDQATKLPESLIQLTKQQTSISNSVNLIVLAFIAYSDNQDIQHSPQDKVEIQFKGKLLQQLVFETPQLFIITSLPASEQKTVHHLIESYRKAGDTVHVIRGEANEVKRIAEMLDMQSPDLAGKFKHPTRRLQEQVAGLNKT